MDRIFDQTEACALAFRRYCLEHNLLDFSLQMELFVRHLLPLRAFREYLFGRYRHLIVDNVEEDTPVSHDLLRAWLPNCESALVLFDHEGGYRTFLGADPDGGYTLERLVPDDAGPVRLTGHEPRRWTRCGPAWRTSCAGARDAIDERDAWGARRPGDAGG